MFAIVDIAGKQFKVSPEQKIFVPKLVNEVGETLQFTKVLLADQEGKVTIGRPHIDGSSITAKVLDHGKDKKVIVFYKKRRKGYRKLKGHREQFTKISIEKVEIGGGN